MRILVRVSFIIVLAVASMAPACAPDDYIRTAALTSHRSIIGLQGARDTNQALLKAQQLTPDQADNITRKIQSASPIVRAFNEAAAVWQAKLDASPQDAKAINAQARVALKADEDAAKKAFSDVRANIEALPNPTARQSLKVALEPEEVKP